MSNIGKRVLGRNKAGVRVIGTITGEEFHGESSLIALDLDGTTSNIVLDYDDFTWGEYPGAPVQ